jgi:plastocyanin
VTLEKAWLTESAAMWVESLTARNEYAPRRFGQRRTLCAAWIIIILGACKSTSNAGEASSIVSNDIATTQRVLVTVMAGRFDPAEVQLTMGTPAVLEFKRVVEGTCMQKLKMPWMEQAVELPINQKVEVPVDTSMSGVFTYSCGMNMVFGEVTIDKAD